MKVGFGLLTPTNGGDGKNMAPIGRFVGDFQSIDLGPKTLI